MKYCFENFPKFHEIFETFKIQTRKFQLTSLSLESACRLPIRDNWTFFTSTFGSDVISRYWLKSALFSGGGSL